MITRLNRLISRFGRARRGAITIEFAFLAALGVTILFSGFEFGRFVLISTKFDRAVSSIGNLVTQSTQVTSGDMTQIFDAGQQILEPYSLGSTGAVFVSEVTADSQDNPMVTWQVKGIGTAADTSAIGDQGGPAKLPSSMTLAAGESVVVVELKYTYKPLLFDLLTGSSQMYRVSYHRPRLSEAVELLP